MIITVLKTNFPKRKEKVINYTNSRNFSSEEFRQQTLNNNSKTTQNHKIISYELFLNIWQRTFYFRQALESMKQKCITFNHSPLIAILKAITNQPWL